MEVYVSVPGYMDYEVSNLGNVVSKKRGKRRLLRPGLSCGYYTVALSRNKIAKTMSVHRLVAMSFIPNTGRLPHINHKNGIRTDNRPENLEWVTHQQNIDHSRVVLGKQTGSSHSAAKFSVEQIKGLYHLYFIERWSVPKISRNREMNSTSVYNILSGRRYKNELCDFIAKFSDLIHPYMIKIISGTFKAYMDKRRLLS